MDLQKEFDRLEEKYGEEFNWWIPPQDIRDFLIQHLRTEFGADNDIFKGEVKALARSEACDDALFEIKGEKNYFMIYHITLSKGAERFKRYRKFDKLEDVLGYIVENYVL